MNTLVISLGARIGRMVLAAVFWHAAAPLQEVSASSPPEPACGWERVFERSVGWTGGDCAGTVPLPGGRTLWLFGDSWIGPVREGKHAEGSWLVNNAVAVHAVTAGAPPAAVEFIWGANDRDGRPTAWVAPDQAARGSGDKNLRYWPTGGGIVVRRGERDATLYVFLMRIRDKAGGDGVWNFEGCGSAVVRIDNPHEGPNQWRPVQSTLTRLPTPPAGARRVAWGCVAVLDQSGPGEPPSVLVYGIDSTDGLNKKLLLARAPRDSVDRFSAWRFWNGRDWSGRADDAEAVADNVMDELTIHREARHKPARFVMIYSKPVLDDHIVARTAPSPRGPWSTARDIYRCPEPAADRRLMAYSAKAHPELSAPGELLITYCVNSNDFGHMAANAWIYRPRFVKADLEAVLHP